MRVFLTLGAVILTGAVTAIALGPSVIPVVDLPPAAPFTMGKIAESRPFGEAFGGKPLWLSANGRYVAMFRLTDDTDGNGKLNIEFGMHGDSWGDDLMLDVFDLETGNHQRFDDLLSGSPNGRYVALRRGSDTLLFDSAEGNTMDLHEIGGGASGDANACMSPRQVIFDPYGEDIALLRDDPAQIAVYTPSSGKSRVVFQSAKPLWRAWFMPDPGQFLVIEVDGSFPRQHTSCVSTSRKVFAASYSFGGLDNDKTTYALIDSQGKRHAFDVETRVIARGIQVTEKLELKRLDGSSIALPAGCRFKDGAEAVRVVILDCASHAVLFDPATGARRELPAGMTLQFLGKERARGRDSDWIAVNTPMPGAGENSDARFRLGRLRISDLRLELGPEVYYNQFTSHPDWMVGARGDTYFAFSIATGELLSTSAKDTGAFGDALALSLDSNTALLLDPERGLAARTGHEVNTGNGRGCFISASGAFDAEEFGGLEKGPWVRVCVT
jgi:nitrite reductase/ring-hydroxylating ferredoxin subunit